MRSNMTSVVICEICSKENFKYTCPKCNLLYCSVECYRSPTHLKCSEEFYKTCIQDEVASADPNEKNDVSKIYDILKRIREADNGLEHDDLDSMDSDDDVDGDVQGDEEDKDLVVRLKDVNINDADAVWKCLTSNEREEFEKLVESDEIFKFLPAYEPWWMRRKKQNSKIVELHAKQDEKKVPAILPNIPKFSDICKKEPSPSLHYNLWNIFSAYTCTVRYFAGEHRDTPNDAAAHLVNLSTTLKYGTNFEEAEDAILSVEMEALTTNITPAAGALGNAAKVALSESRGQLEEDVRQIMSSVSYKLAALSDITRLFQLAKRQVKTSQTEEAAMQKLFAMCISGVELNYKKLQQLIRKMEFLLAYVNMQHSPDE